jgi:hypothetical protein
MNIRAFVIHLERSEQRRPQAERIIAHCPFPCEIIAAVDGLVMGAEAARAYQPGLLKPHYPFELRNSEVAVFLSHRKCWQRIVSEGLDAGLILEDDVEFDPLALQAALDLAKKAGAGAYVRLPYRQRESVREISAMAGSAQLFIAKGIGLGAQAQLVTLVAARQLLVATESFDRPVDTFIQMRWHHGVKVFSVQPSSIREISGALGGTTIHKKFAFFAKFKREIKRFIYRLKVAYLSRRSGQP